MRDEHQKRNTEAVLERWNQTIKPETKAKIRERLEEKNEIIAASPKTELVPYGLDHIRPVDYRPDFEYDLDSQYRNNVGVSDDERERNAAAIERAQQDSDLLQKRHQQLAVSRIRHARRSGPVQRLLHARKPSSRHLYRWPGLCEHERPSRRCAQFEF